MFGLPVLSSRDDATKNNQRNFFPFLKNSRSSLMKKLVIVFLIRLVSIKMIVGSWSLR